MNELLSPILASAALLVSCTTAWLTIFRRGSLKITRPSVIYFGADGPLKVSEQHKKKIFVRALLYSTGKRGCVIESMHATLNRGGASQTFSLWVYGDKDLLRGSGLFVGETGFASNHHFLRTSGGTYEFLEGQYRLEIFATLVGQTSPHKLCTVELTLEAEIAKALEQPTAGVYFDWLPESGKYSPHVKNVAYTIEIPKVVVAGA
jgi:hypothetical protein